MNNSAVSGKTIYWYDFETFGVDPRRDRASQFAGVRTDEELNIIGEPLVLYCKPADDFLPNPVSCLITGITPQKALTRRNSSGKFTGNFQSPGPASPVITVFDLMTRSRDSCCTVIFMMLMSGSGRTAIRVGISLICYGFAQQPAPMELTGR